MLINCLESWDSVERFLQETGEMHDLFGKK